jgi:L-lactate utilization protein LutB
MRVGTCYCICSKCNQPCNIFIPIRKTWKINPSTKVKRDKREKQRTKEVDKEIKEIGCA